MEDKMMQKRLSNIELLRILAMIMVVILHYLSKGELLPNLTEGFENVRWQGITAWMLEALCIVAVNVYMLISGYFLVENSFKVKKVLTLLCQILFYTLLVPVVLMVFGVIGKGSFTWYDYFMNLLPIQMNHYWFATAYILMYLFVPVLNPAVKNMSQKSLQRTLCVLLLVFSVSKTILPIELTIDGKGYDVVWFLIVYLIAAYIRLYGISWMEGKKALLCYLGTTLLIFLSILLLGYVSFVTGKFANFYNTACDYNDFLCILASVALFQFFRCLKLKEGNWARLIRRIAPYTFGVYLLHEQVSIRFLWPKWLFATKAGESPFFILEVLAAAATVFLAGITVDWVRAKLFTLLGKTNAVTWMSKKCDEFDR